MGFDKRDITASMVDLDALYTANASTSLYYSKLAVVELCGWIEFVMDEIVIDFATRRLVSTHGGCTGIFENQIRKKNYGFSYENNFTPLLYKTIGICKFERLENKLIANGYHAIMTRILSSLHEKRNDAAHTDITNAKKTYDTPSIMKGHLDSLYPIFKFIQKEVNKLR